MLPLDNQASLLVALPEVILALGCMVVLALGLVWPRISRFATAGTTVLVLAVAAAATIATGSDSPRDLFGGLLVRDRFGDFFRVLAALAGIGVALMAVRSFDAVETQGDVQGGARTGVRGGDDRESPEFFALMIAAVLGVALMAGAADMLLAYLGLELVSVMSYVLTGFTRGSRRSAEAALKYVIYGGVASGAFLYGLSLLYGFSGTTALADARAAIAAAPTPLALAAVMLCLAGLGYKVAVVPFHMWCPDVYQGAPTPVAAFLSVAPKAGGFALLLRFFGSGTDVSGATGEGTIPWMLLALVIAVVTMTLGNLAALGQRNIKRLLAYSSIAHAGYLFLGVAAGAPGGHRAILMYFGLYLFMSLGAFAVVVAVGRASAGAQLDDQGSDQDGDQDSDNVSESFEQIASWAGLGRRMPLAAFTMTVALVALAGLPPTAGFVGKYYLFAATIARGRQLGEGMFYAAALIAVLNSVVSLYYYARIIRAMYIDPAPAAASPVRLPAPLPLLLVLLLVPILALGLYWAPLDALTAAAVRLPR